MPELIPPVWLIRAAVAGVWLYEGLWCKLLNGDPNQFEVVKAAPMGPRIGRQFLLTLGVAEVLLGVWVLSGVALVPCAVAQTLLLLTLNTNGLIWSRHLIHDPAGMVFKNFVLVVLAWVAASLPRWP